MADSKDRSQEIRRIDYQLLIWTMTIRGVQRISMRSGRRWESHSITSKGHMINSQIVTTENDDFLDYAYN